jgi:hypothetical protein
MLWNVINITFSISLVSGNAALTNLEMRTIASGIVEKQKEINLK